MSQRRLPSLGEVPHLVHDQLGELHEASKNLADEVKNDPQSFLANPVFRLTGMIIGGIAGVVLLVYGVQAITPPAPAGADREPSAIVHTACTQEKCRHHALVNMPIDFDSWPRVCSKCQTESVYRAKRCKITRRWYANAPGQPDVSPFKPQKASEIVSQSTPKPKRGDDAEDAW